MKKAAIMKRTAAALLLTGTLVLQTVPAMAVLPPATDTMDSIAVSLDTNLSDLLSDSSMLPAGDSVSDWIAFLAGRTGNKEVGKAYLQRAEEYVTSQYEAQGCLDPIMATSWHRLILTTAALGANPTAFGTDADGEPVNLLKDGCYDFHAVDSFDVQGLNAWLYALIALDSYCYKVPDGATYTREVILERLVQAQEADGGFGLTKGSSDVDITAMVLQALAPYQHNTVRYPDRDSFLVTIREVTDKALDYLSAQQQSNGGFMSYDSNNSESCSQVILALCALGIDPATDSRFVKEGGSPVDALESFLQEDGTYSHDGTSGDDVMATQQAAFATFALEQLQNGQRRIYDLRREGLDEAIALELKMKDMSDEDLVKEADSLLEEYEKVAPEDRSYVYSITRAIPIWEEGGISFDEETSQYYNLNDEAPVTADAGVTEKKIPVALYAGIAVAVVAAAGVGYSVVAKKGKKEETEKKPEKKKPEKKVKW